MPWLELLPAVVLRPMCVSALTTCRRLICVGPGFGIDGFGIETWMPQTYPLRVCTCYAVVSRLCRVCDGAATTRTSETCHEVRWLRYAIVKEAPAV